MKRHLKALAFALALSFLPSFGAALHAEEAAASEAKTRQVVDDAGREVEIPLEIQSVAPSGGVATLVLFTAAPEKLAAVSRSFSKPQLKYLDKKYADLPEIGQFYGKKANLNLEELLRIKPDLIIDIGEKKKTVKEDMDGIQEQTGIPTLFIEALTPEMGSFSGVSRKDVGFVFWPVLIGTGVIIAYRWRLNLLSLGSDSAKSLGIHLKRDRAIILMAATLLTAASVSVAGMISWVGLVIPHFAKIYVGADHRRAIPAAALMGAAFLLLVDDLARLLSTGEIPLGVLTAFVGAPIFLYLIFREGRR